MVTMRVFIDTNTYLQFIERPNEKLQSLDELKNLMKDGEITLVFPDITRDEFHRNYPAISMRYVELLRKNAPKRPPMSAVLKSKGKKQKTTRLEQVHKRYIEEINKAAKRQKESVEKLVKKIDQLKNKAEDINDDAGIVEAAQVRRLRGNPPGKKQGPLGDEIAWETLLRFCTDDDLVIISGDSDWKHLMESEPELNPLLRIEWEKVSEKKITLYETLGVFINDVTEPDTIPSEEIDEERQAARELQSNGRGYISSPGLASQGLSGFVAASDLATSSQISALGHSPGLYLDDGQMFRVGSPNPVAWSIMGKKCTQCGKEIDGLIGSICTECQMGI